MQSSCFTKAWQMIRKRLSETLIICLIVTNITPAFTTNAASFDYRFVNELAIDDTLIDDGMFYMPHGILEVNEKDSKSKYFIKIKRKGEAGKAEKVKLSMIDVSAKYGRDYSIKVILF